LNSFTSRPGELFCSGVDIQSVRQPAAKGFHVSTNMVRCFKQGHIVAQAG